MGNGNSGSARLRLEVLPEDELKYEEMALAPPETMGIMKEEGSDGGAFTTPKLPWPMYILDAWYSPEIAPFMVSNPRGFVKLTPTDIELLRSQPAAEACEALALKVQSQIPSIENNPSQLPYFVRLSMCSTKIGTRAKPAHTGIEVVQQILDSRRCVDSLACPIDHTIWLFEWKASCNVIRELRVFIRGKKVVAIAPYYCAVPLDWLNSSTACAVGESVLDFFELIKDLMPFEDAVMDVLYTEEKTVKLIEFNPIVTSGGGLFSWVDDIEILAGRMNGPPVMRIVHARD